MPDNSAYLERVGVTLQVLRLMRGISQAELAQRADIRPNQVSRYETSQVLPQLPQLAKMLDALCIDLGEFTFATRLLIQLDAVLDGLEGSPASDALLDELARAHMLRVSQIMEAVKKLPTQEAPRAGAR